MSLPPRAFYPMNEVAIRLSVKPLDIIGWAIDGRIALSAALPLIETKQKRPVEGLVEICGQDVFELFSTESDKKACVRIQRFRRRAGGRWERIIVPADGVPLKSSGVVITRKEIERFERDYPETAARAEPAGEYKSAKSADSVRSSQVGAPPRFDWDRYTGAFARRIHDKGLPETQGQLIRDMLDWFATTFGVVPDESTVRRRVKAAWKELIREDLP